MNHTPHAYVWAAVYGVARVGHDWSDLAAAAALSSELCVFLKPTDLWFFPSS